MKAPKFVNKLYVSKAEAARWSHLPGIVEEFRRDRKRNRVAIYWKVARFFRDTCVVLLGVLLALVMYR